MRDMLKHVSNPVKDSVNAVSDDAKSEKAENLKQFSAVNDEMPSLDGIMPEQGEVVEKSTISKEDNYLASVDDAYDISAKKIEDEKSPILSTWQRRPCREGIFWCIPKDKLMLSVLLVIQDAYHIDHLDYRFRMVFDGKPRSIKVTGVQKCVLALIIGSQVMPHNDAGIIKAFTRVLLHYTLNGTLPKPSKMIAFFPANCRADNSAVFMLRWWRECFLASQGYDDKVKVYKAVERLGALTAAMRRASGVLLPRHILTSKSLQSFWNSYKDGDEKLRLLASVEKNVRSTYFLFPYKRRVLDALARKLLGDGGWYYLRRASSDIVNRGTRSNKAYQRAKKIALQEGKTPPSRRSFNVRDSPVCNIITQNVAHSFSDLPETSMKIVLSRIKPNGRSIIIDTTTEDKISAQLMLSKAFNPYCNIKKRMPKDIANSSQKGKKKKKKPQKLLPLN
jgi:hypothetical protein